MSLLLLRGSASHLPLASESVQCVVTSPPYWGLRQYAGEQREVWGGHSIDNCWRCQDYGSCRHEHRWTARDGSCECGAWYGALGLEPTPELYIAHLVAVFQEVKRVLRRDGTCWINIGDSYNGSGHGGNGGDSSGLKLGKRAREDADMRQGFHNQVTRVPGLKAKDLVGIPWMVAFALRADGWYLRSDIIWAKPNPMPESVTDRPTKAHEYLFLLSKSQTYYYDADAIREPASYNTHARKARVKPDHKSNPTTERNGIRAPGVGPKASAAGSGIRYNESFAAAVTDIVEERNKRTVWTIATRPYPGAHFATYPEDLVEPCILAGSAAKACGQCGAPWERVTEREGIQTYHSERTEEYRAQGLNTRFNGAVPGTPTSPRITTTGWRATCAHSDDTGKSLVLDPFNGSGTTGRVAIRHGRNYVGLDISDEYLKEQSRARIDNIQHVMGGLGV